MAIASAAASARTEELYRRHGHMVGGLCRALLRDRSEADDAAQQVFLSAHRALVNGSVPREPAAWLATIARNECRSRARGRRLVAVPLDEVGDAGASLPDPLAEAIRRADLAALWRAIRALPRTQREAILLREFGGLSYDELGEALALSGGAIESLLFRARRRLRDTFGGIAGTSWLEPIVRTVAGGSAPIAAKAVFLGLGAAALSGGAVLAPRTLDGAARPHPVRTQSVAPPRLVAPPVRALPAPGARARALRSVDATADSENEHGTPPAASAERSMSDDVSTPTPVTTATAIGTDSPPSTGADVTTSADTTTTSETGGEAMITEPSSTVDGGGGDGGGDSGAGR